MVRISRAAYLGNKDFSALHGMGSWVDLHSLGAEGLNGLRYAKIELNFSMAASEVTVDTQHELENMLADCVRDRGFTIEHASNTSSMLNAISGEGTLRVFVNVWKRPNTNLESELQAAVTAFRQKLKDYKPG